MALKSNIEDIGVRIDPISFTADISVLWGNTTQVGNGRADGYMPSRDVVPCVLLPIVDVADPDQFMSGRQKLVTCYWYEGTPNASGSNMITADTVGYEIVTEAGPNQYALKVRKNFPINTSQIIHVKFTILDVRNDTVVEMERQIVFRTVEFDENMLHLQLTDCPSVLKIDPFDEADCGDNPWNHTISVQMYQGRLPYDDAKTTYKWQIFDKGTSKYRDFTADEKQICVSGTDTKHLTFDARFAESEAFRCTALPKDRQGWKMALTANVAVDVRIAETVIAEIACVKGLRINPHMNQVVEYECNLAYNKGKIPADKYGLFRILWKAKDDRVGAVEKHLGEGKTCAFVPADFGFDCKHYTSVYAEVQLRKFTAVVVNSDRKVITSNSKVLVANVYK